MRPNKGPYHVFRGCQINKKHTDYYFTNWIWMSEEFNQYLWHVCLIAA